MNSLFTENNEILFIEYTLLLSTLNSILVYLMRGLRDMADIRKIMTIKKMIGEEKMYNLNEAGTI